MSSGHRSGPWQSANFRRFFTAQSISVAGGALSPVALALAVLNATGSAKSLAVLLVCQDVPLLAFLLIGGAAADRWPRKRLLVLSNSAAGLTQFAVGLLLLSSHVHLTLIAPLEVLNGMSTAFTSPALRGIVPSLVDASGLQRANSLIATSKNAAKVLGPTLGSLLVVSVGGGWAVIADALSYLIAAAIFATLDISGNVSRPSAMWGELRAGWREFRHQRWALVVVSASSATNFLLAGAWLVLGPAIARHTVGEAAWGVALSARAGGLLLTGVVLYRVTFRRFMAVGQACAALFAPQIIVLGLGMPSPVLIAACIVGGAGSAVYGIAWETSLQEHIDPAMLSRVAAYDSFGSFLAVPLGQLLVVPLAVEVGQERVTVIAGLLYGAIALAALIPRSVRNLSHFNV